MHARPTHHLHRVLAGVGLSVLLMTLAASPIETAEPEANSTPSRATSDAAGPDEKPKATLRRREGDTYEGLGEFKSTGDRITFDSEDRKETFRVLENLALERIARIVEDPSGLGVGRKWRVAGTITEFRGNNYLLIERAILKAREQ